MYCHFRPPISSLSPIVSHTFCIASAAPPPQAAIILPPAVVRAASEAGSQSVRSGLTKCLTLCEVKELK